MTDTPGAPAAANVGGFNRRDALKLGSLAAASVLSQSSLPHVYAGESNTVQLALVGCGGRGTGAVQNALQTKVGPTKLVAMADVFEDRLKNSYEGLSGSNFQKQIDVPNDRKFIGFDGYKHAMDSLKKGDVVILTTPVAFRGVHFKYAIEKGLNVFMEKPITIDGPSTRRMLALGEESVQKNLKVGVGLMCRHCEARGELYQRIKAGELGELTLLRGYRVTGPTGSAFAKKKPAGISELEYQIRNFHAFLWASGGAVSDFMIHNIDECCWMKDDWPVEVKAMGGRHYRGDYVDQNFDSYSFEYTFADGCKFFMEGRGVNGCNNEFASYCHGTKGSAVISASGHAPSKCRIFKSQRMVKQDLVWKCKDQEPSPYDLEWDHLMEAIRKDRPYNEVERGAKASLVTAMGRLAAHTGQVITYEQALNHHHDLAAGVDTLTFNSPPPVVADADGKYPIPQPGLITDTEFPI